MSARIFGFAPNEIKLQPGFAPKNSGNGGWTATAIFAVKAEAWRNLAVRQQFRKGLPITTISTDIDSYWSFLAVTEHEVVYEEGDIVMVKCTVSGGEAAQFGGGDSLAPGSSPTYRLEFQLQEHPMDQHSKWTPLSVIEKSALGLLLRGSVEFDPPTGKVGSFNPETGEFNGLTDSSGADLVVTSSDGVEFANRIAQGRTTYDASIFTWTENTEGPEGLSPAQLNKAGKIATPRGAPPNPGAGRNWKLTGGYQENTSGGLYRTSLQWDLSDAGGHDAFLYDT